MSVSRLKRRLRYAGLMVVATLLTLVVLEGLASLGFFIAAVATRSQPALAERNHTQFDAELGWVSKPGMRLRDLYGPGIDLNTNAQGFRGTVEFSKEVPDDKTRVICSGDSFTLGYGVRDGETWCAQLASLQPSFQTVNMGQGGYGVDQAYLWYMRDGEKLQHDLHLFSFIYDDFVRMTRSRFLGYAKPTLSLVDGEIQIGNVPVPRRAYLLPWFTQNSGLLDELRSFAALRSLVRTMSSGRTSDGRLSDSVRVALAAFEQLAARNREHGSMLVLVYLPVEEDYTPGSFDRLRATLADWARTHGVEFVDLVPDYRTMPADQAMSLFIPEGASAFPDAAGHYSKFGNRVIAGYLHRHLSALLSATPSAEMRSPEAAGE